MNMQKLTVFHYGETTEEDRRITLSLMNITVVAAATEDTTVNGRSLRSVAVLFTDGSSVDLLINHEDMMTIETAVGSYCFE